MATEDHKRLYENAKLLCEDGKYAEAIQILDELARDRPDSKHVMATRGLCLASMGHLKDAKAVCERLTHLHGSEAKQFVSKIELKIREKEKELRKINPEYRVSSVPTAGESVPKSGGSPILWLLLGVLVVVGAVVGVYVATRPGSSSRTGQVEVTEGVAGFRAVGDKYVEVSTFYPNGSEVGFQAIVVLAPRSGSSGETEGQIADNVGGVVAANWEVVKKRSEEALTLSGIHGETVDGNERSEMVCTVVFPKAGIGQGVEPSNSQIETFTPASRATLADVVSACGKPEHEEMWAMVSNEISVTGRVNWWGRVGVATDDSGAISHLLVKHRPKGRAS